MHFSYYVMPIVANYEYTEIIGNGAFGTIYKGKNRRTNAQVVIKMEPLDVEFSSIKHESTILNILYSKHCRNIPPTYWYGTVDSPPRRILVMPFYKESLEDISFTQRGLSSSSLINNSSNTKSTTILRSFREGPMQNVKIASNIMRSAISILDNIHSKYVVHRDIKPANFMIHNEELILIDFGLASFYVDTEERHIQPANPKKRHIVGTSKYVSWNVHRGEEYSRRDDLMSMVYVGLFLLYGNKLWSGEVDNTDVLMEKSDILHPVNRFYESHKTVQNILKKTEEWSELMKFSENVYRLSFQERPSYKEYIELFLKTI